MDDSAEIRITPDALIAMLVTEAEARELAAMPSIEDMNEEFHPSEKFKQRMEKLLQEASRKSERARVGRGVKKGFVTVAAAISLFSCVMFPTPAVREAVVSTLLNWQEKFVSIVFTKEESSMIELPQYVEDDYVPDGYFLAEPVYRSTDAYYAQYTSPGNGWYAIRVLQITNTQDTALDSEFASYYSLEFGDHQAIWGIMKDGSNTLVWESSGLSFQIIGNIDLTEIMKIAEGLRLSSR